MRHFRRVLEHVLVDATGKAMLTVVVVVVVGGGVGSTFGRPIRFFVFNVVEPNKYNYVDGQIFDF